MREKSKQSRNFNLLVIFARKIGCEKTRGAQVDESV